MKTNDQVILVDENDQEIGVMDKVEAHRGEAKRHRAISVYLFSRHPELVSGSSEEVSERDIVWVLLQQRSEQKIVGADQWANTVCGNVRPNESYEECAYRRLREELGITEVEIKPVYKFEYHLQCGTLTEVAKATLENSETSRNLRDNEEFSEWEMDQVFVGWYDGEVNPNPEEAQNYAWVNWEQLISQKAKDKKKEYGALETELRNVELTINHQTLSITVAPWFVWMLGDRKLIEKLNTFIKSIN